MGVPTVKTLRDGKAAICERTISRFRRTYRRRLRKFANLATPMADLVTSFPAAAFAMVTEFGLPQQRQRARQFVMDGAPLKTVAKALGLPFWTRKLPPEAFIANLPDHLPDQENFGAQFVGLMPEDPDEVGGWLRGVLIGQAIAGDTFALWLAKYPKLLPANAEPRGVQLLALFAWVSLEKASPAAKLLPGRWNEKIAPPRAGELARGWVQAIQRELVMGASGLRDTWLLGGRAAGFRFVPLRTIGDLEAEAKAMDNCVRDYAATLATGKCRLFGIRRGAQHVATVEIRPHAYHAGIPQIIQLYGPDNEDAPDHVWAAAFTWLGKQRRYDLPDDGVNAIDVVNAATWQQLWRPYWRQVGQHPLLPETVAADTLSMLSAAADDINRHAHR